MLRAIAQIPVLGFFHTSLWGQLALAFHPNGDWLAAAGGDNSGFLMFFDLADSIAVSEGGDAVYAVGHGKIAKWTVSV